MTTTDAEEPRGRPFPPPRLGGEAPREGHVPHPDDDEPPPEDVAEARTLLEPGRRPATMEVPPGISPAKRKEMDQNFDEVMSSFDFSTSEYKVVLVRTKPQLFKGQDIAGYLGSYDKPLSTDEVKNTYGGGSYTWQIHGPNPRLGGRQTLLKNMTFKIAGDPILASQPNNEPDNQVPQLVKAIVDAKDRDVQRLTKEAEETRKMLLQQSGRADSGMKEVVAAMAAMANPAGLKEALAEERRALEIRLKDEREERKREADVAERRHQEFLRSMELKHEKELAEIKARAEVDRLAAREASSAKSSSSDTMLMLMQKMQADQIAMINTMNATQEKRSQDSQLFMSQMQQAQQTALMSQMTQMEAMKSEFLTKQLERLENRKDDAVESIQKIVAMRDLFDDLSGRSDKRDTWERVADTVKDAAPGLLAALSGGNRAAAPPGPPKIAAGSVAMVDITAPAPTRRVTRKGKKRPTTFTEGLAPAAPAQAPAPLPEWVPEIAGEDLDTETAVKMLVANIEKALGFDWEMKQVYDQILSKYPKAVLDLLKSAGPEQCLVTIGNMAPADWAINTLRGKKLIEDMFRVFVSA